MSSTIQAEAEEGVVVGRRALDDAPRTRCRAASKLARAEVGPAQRLADRGLLRARASRALG